MASQSDTGKAKTKTAAKSEQPELDINKLINIAFDLCCRRNDLSDEDWKKAKEKAKEDAIKEVKPFVEYHLKQHATAAV